MIYVLEKRNAESSCRYPLFLGSENSHLKIDVLDAK
jgi:hypothetical protein